MKQNRTEENRIEENRLKLCLWLFGINLFISAFTFGGGYVVVPMVRKYYVEKKGLFDEEALMEMAAISQSSPGAIAINLTALAGYRAAGKAGAAVSCIAAVLPPFFILALISKWYAAFAANTVVMAVLKGMQAAVAAIMVDLIADMTSVILGEKSLFFTCMIPAAFIANFIFQVNAALVLVLCGAASLFRLYVSENASERTSEKASERASEKAGKERKL